MSHPVVRKEMAKHPHVEFQAGKKLFHCVQRGPQPDRNKKDTASSAEKIMNGNVRMNNPPLIYRINKYPGQRPF